MEPQRKCCFLHHMVCSFIIQSIPAINSVVLTGSNPTSVRDFFLKWSSLRDGYSIVIPRNELWLHGMSTSIFICRITGFAGYSDRNLGCGKTGTVIVMRNAGHIFATSAGKKMMKATVSDIKYKRSSSLSYITTDCSVDKNCAVISLNVKNSKKKEGWGNYDSDHNGYRFIYAAILIDGIGQ